MQQNSQQNSAAAVLSSPSITTKQSAIMQIFGAALFGMILIFGVGFASADLAHNAAHDGRHAVAFPCH